MGEVILYYLYCMLPCFVIAVAGALLISKILLDNGI
ncbi:MAG: hypothetical protein Pg6A_19580 [Termitinemataceae bacterium]|nr:MAG: hypothetical protein Pg6A_19580 [Termitinemataceae bacterium]